MSKTKIIIAAAATSIFFTAYFWFKHFTWSELIQRDWYRTAVEINYLALIESEIRALYLTIAVNLVILCIAGTLLMCLKLRQEKKYNSHNNRQ